ncbi:hypothetical protein ACS0TY_029546 [Phlomoides rotata]
MADKEVCVNGNVGQKKSVMYLHCKIRSLPKRGRQEITCYCKMILLTEYLGTQPKNSRSLFYDLWSFVTLDISKRGEDATEKEIHILKVTLYEHSTSIDIDDEYRISLKHIKRKIQRNYNKNPSAWWDKNRIEAILKDKKDMQTIIKEHINLKLIELLHIVAPEFC